MKLPDIFQFTADSDDDGSLYTATKMPNGVDYEITWEGADILPSYSTISVKSLVGEGCWKIVSQTDECFLSRIKTFTEATNASVFITDGAYEVFYDGAASPAKAATDEDMEKLMNAIVVLDGATY